MPRFPTRDPVRVRVGDCTCPDSPHAGGDFVVLRRRLPLDGGAAAIQALSADGSNVTEAGLAVAILPYMIESWDFIDAESKDPLPITPESVREALPWNQGGREVLESLAEALADTPLSSKVSRKRTAKRSNTTRTAG
jgi:hypothetical protein